jgi:membrane protease YdiL (CAAX protease family)
MIIQSLIDAFIQLIIFSFIPLLWWLITARKKENLFTWLGFIAPKSENKSKVLLFSFLSFGLLLGTGLYIVSTFEDKSVLASAHFAGLGFGGLIPVLIYSFIQTGLAEEILFRGFLLKRLSSRFGFNAGNAVQAVLFGLVHGILLFRSVTVVFAILIIVFTAVIGWLMGYLNEKAGGSIVPSWIIHGLSNFASSFIFLFDIVKV